MPNSYSHHPSPLPRGAYANLTEVAVFGKLRDKEVYLTTETQRLQRRGIFLGLSGDADKPKSLGLFVAKDVRYILHAPYKKHRRT